jgi:hypothetical protein
MTRSLKTAVSAFAAIAAFAPLLAASDAMAGGRGKDYYVQEYYFDRAMNGKEGFAGAYFCSYIKQPVKLRKGRGRSKRMWKLTQVCQ